MVRSESLACHKDCSASSSKIVGGSFTAGQYNMYLHSVASSPLALTELFTVEESQVAQRKQSGCLQSWRRRGCALGGQLDLERLGWKSFYGERGSGSVSEG